MVERYNSVKSIDEIVTMHREWRKDKEGELNRKQKEIADEIERLLERSRRWHGLSYEEVCKLRGADAESHVKWREEFDKVMLKAIQNDIELLHNPIVEDWKASRKLFGEWSDDIIQRMKLKKEDKD